MEPKKTRIVDIAIPIIACALILCFAVIAANTHDIVKLQPTVNVVGEETTEKYNFSLFLDEFTERSNDFKLEYSESVPKFVGIASLACLLGVAYILTSKKKYIDGKEHGTAEWGTPKQVAYLTGKSCCQEEIKKIKKQKISKIKKDEKIKEAHKKYDDSDMLLTATEKISLYHTDSLNNNSLIVAGSGAGKTTGYAMPNILQAANNDYSPCYVVTDPKGELLQRVGYFLKEVAGYKVRVLNLKDQKQSFRYNPFKYIDVRKDPGELENQIKKLATAIMEYKANADAQSGDEFWTIMSVNCCEALMLATHYGFPESERNMNTVIWLFSMLVIDDDDTECDLDKYFERYKEKYKEDHAKMAAYRKYREFRNKCKGKTGSSVLATMQSKLGAFDNVNVKRIFSDDDFELESLGEERVAIFVVLPPMDRAFNFIANLLYIQMFDMIEFTATVKHEQRLPIPVRFILDEFYNSGKIPLFANILSYARSYGVSISVIIQSLDQLKEMYEKSWGVIVDNCSTFVYLGGVSHMESLKYISDKLGKGTFDKKNSSETKGRQSSNTINNDKLGRELLLPDEVAKINNRKCILFISGKNPYYSKKNFFKNHKNYKYTWDADKTNNVFTMELPKKEINTQEKKQAAQKEKPKPNTLGNRIKEFFPPKEEIAAAMPEIVYDPELTVKKFEENYEDIEFVEDEELFSDNENYEEIDRTIVQYHKDAALIDKDVLEQEKKKKEEKNIEENKKEDEKSPHGEDFLKEPKEPKEPEITVIEEEMADLGDAMDLLSNIDLDM